MVDPTSILKDWGLNLGVLAIVAGFAVLILVFSFREFTYWFLRIDKVVKNQEEILARLEKMEQTSLAKTSPQPSFDVLAPQNPTPEKESFQILN